MSTALTLITILAGGAFWQYLPKIVELIFARKKEINKELKEDGKVFREYLMAENAELKTKLDTLIKSNEALIESNLALNSKLEIALKELEDKNDIIAKMEKEVENLKQQITILNNLLKK